jgi:hypothetical protein
MEPMPAEDSEAIMNLVTDGMRQVLSEAAERLDFPLKAVAQCPAGYILTLEIPYAGADPICSELREDAPMVTFPITLIVTGRKGGKVTGTIQQPEPHTEGNA